MEGVPGLRPAGSTQSKANSRDLLDKLGEISSTLEQTEKSLRKKRLKLLIPGIPLSRKAALQMDIDRTEALVKQLGSKKRQIEVDLDVEIPKKRAEISSDEATPLRPSSAGPSCGVGGQSSRCMKDGAAGGRNQVARRRMSVSPTFGMASSTCSTPSKHWPKQALIENVLRKSSLFACLGSGSDQNQIHPVKNEPQNSSSLDAHTVTPGPSQFDFAQSSIETHRNRDHQSSAQTSSFWAPTSCHNTQLLNQSLSLSSTDRSTDSENTNIHSSQAVSMIQDGYASTSCSDSSFVDGVNAPCYKPVPSASPVLRQDELGANGQNFPHAPLQQSNPNHLPNSVTTSTKALNDIELILKKFTMGLNMRRELSEKINEIRAGFAQTSRVVAGSSKTSFRATSCANSQDNRSKTLVRSVSDDTLQASARGNSRPSLEKNFQVETLLSRIKALEKDVRFQTDINLELRAKLKWAEDTSRAYKTQLESGNNPGWEGKKKMEVFVQELLTEKEQVGELVKELEKQLQFQANAHVDQFNKLKQTEAELHKHKAIMDDHKVKEAIERDKLNELIRSLRGEKEASEQLVNDLKGQLNDERMVRENAEKSVRDCQENLNAKQNRLDLLQADSDSRLTLVSDLKDEVASAKEQSEQALKMAKQQSEFDLKSLTEELAELKGQVASLTERSEKGEVALKVAQSELQRSEAQVEKLVAAADAWNEKAEGLDSAAKSDLLQSEAEVKLLRQKLVEFDSVKLEEDVAREERLQDLRLMFEMEEKKNKELSNEKVELESKIGQLQELCDSLKSDYSIMQQQLGDLKSKDALNETLKTQLSEESNKSQNENSELQRDIRGLRIENTALKKKADSLAATLEELSESLENVTALKTNNAMLLEKMSSQSGALHDLELEKSKVKKSLDDKTAELERQKMTHDERTEKLKKQLAEMKNRFDEKTSELAQETEARKIESDEMKKLLNDQEESLSEKALQLVTERERTGQLEKQLAETRKSLEEKTSELARLTQQLETQLADSRKSLDEKETELEMERRLHKTKMESLMALNKSFQDNESPEKLVKNYKDQLITAEEELKHSVSDLKEAKRLLLKARMKVRNETESSDIKAEKESVNVILLAQDVSKMLLVEFERAEKLTAEVATLKSAGEESTKLLDYRKSEIEKLIDAKVESVEKFETCMLDVEKLEAENEEKEQQLGARKTEMEKLEVENKEKEKLLGSQKCEIEKLKKSFRACHAKLELEQMFLSECRSSLEAEQKLLGESQTKLEAETKTLKDCRSKLAKEQTSLREATMLSKILQKNVDDALKFMNDYKDKYQASEARFAEMRLGSSSDYCTGSDASSGSSPVLDSGENMTQSIRTDESKALDLTVTRKLIKNAPAVCMSSVDSGIRNSGEFSNADIESKQRAHLVEELNKELTLVQNENHYLEHCLKDLEREGRECRTRCQELSELNLNLVKEKSALSAKVKELSKRVMSNSEDKLCQESVMVAESSGTQSGDQEKEGGGNEIDSAEPSSCGECTNLKQMLKDSEERVSEMKVMFQGELAKCISERDELKEKYNECDKIRLQLEKVKSALEVQAQNVGEHDVVHCRLRLQGEQERTRQLNELLQREHEELEKCRKERDILDVKLKEQSDIEKQLQKDKQTLLMCVKEFQLETANEKTSPGRKKASNDKPRCAGLDVQSTVKVEQWLQEQVGRHDMSPVKGGIGCSDCHKLQMSLSNLESEKQDMARSLAEMNQAYEQLAGLKKENDATETSPVGVADQDAGKRRTRAAVSLAQRVDKLDAELLSMRVKLDSMTETKRKSEESLAEALRTSAADRQKLELVQDDLAFMSGKLKSTQADLAVKRNDVVKLQQDLRSETECSQVLLQSNNKLKTKLENKDHLIEGLALELKGTKSKLTQQTFDFTDTKSALQLKERIVADLTYRLKMLCSNFSNMNVPRPQDVEDLKLYLKNMESTPKAEAESSTKMKQLVDDYDSSSDEMEEVRSVRISSPRNIQHVDENLHEKDVAELKKHNRKLLELYNTQEKLIEHLSEEKRHFQEMASKEWREERVKRLESENKNLRDELVALQEVVSDLQEKARKRGKESSVVHDRLSRSEAKSRRNSCDDERHELQITVKNLRGQLQVERLAAKSLKDEKNALKEILQKSEREVEHLRLRFLDLSKSECEQKMEYALLQGDAKLWTKEKGRFQEILAVSRNEIKTLEKAVSTLQGTVDDLRKELGAERLGCASLKDEAKIWVSERRQLVMDLEVTENERQKFQGQLEEAAKQAKADEGKVQEFAQQAKALQESELELKRQMQVMEADVKDKSDRILVYEQVLKQVKHLNVTNNLNRQLGIVRNEKQQVLNVLSEKEKEVALLNLDLKQQEASFKEAMDAKENALLSLQSGIAVLTKQLNSSRSKAVGMLQMIQEKETEVRHVTKKFEVQVTMREETIALLKKKIKELEHNFEMLKNEHEIMNISKALDENLVAELRRDFEVMEHKVADLKFQNTELDMKKAELTDKNFEFLTKIEKLEQAVKVKDDIMEACKEQLLLMSNQLDITYNHKDADGQTPDLEGLAMKQAQLNEREAKLVEKEMLEQKRLDTLNVKEKEVEKLKNVLKNREADLKKREMTVASFEEEARSKVKDQFNGCLSELQTSRKEEYQALDEALKVRETRNIALDESLKARELTVSDKEADLIAREELLNGCHLEIQELAGAVTILEGDVGTLKQNLYAKEACLETSKQTCANLETKLAAALDELLTEKQKRKLRSCVKTKSVKTMTDCEVSDAIATPVLEIESDTVAKPVVVEPETSAVIPEIKEVKSTETQTMRDNFGINFCHRCGVLLDLKTQEKTSEDPDAKDVSSDKTLSSDSEDCIVRDSSETGVDPEVLMEAEAYFVVTEPLKDATVLSQELCVANRQPDGTLSISPLKNLTFGDDVAVLQTACEQVVLEEAKLREKFDELRSSIAELRSEVIDRESCTYKELDTIKELEDEMKRIIANLTGEIKALEARLADAVKETPELKAAITALEKYLASERVAHGDMKTKYVNERNLNTWLEKQLQEARNEIDLAKIVSGDAELVLQQGVSPTDTNPTIANLLHPPLPATSSVRKRKQKGMKTMGECAKVARKSPSKSPKARPRSPARARSPGRVASPRDGPRMKQVAEKMDEMGPHLLFTADTPVPEAEVASPSIDHCEQPLTVIKTKKDKAKKRMWYPCTICHKTFTDPFFFKNHLRCHERQHFFCTLCDKNFSNKRLYATHLLMHDKVDAPPPEYRCCVCNIECTSAIELKIHMIKHPALEDSLKPHKCRKCHKAFVLMSGLKAHSRVHKKGRKKFSPKKKRKRSTPTCGNLELRPLDFEPIAQHVEVELRNPVVEIENLVVNSEVEAQKQFEELPGVVGGLPGVKDKAESKESMHMTKEPNAKKEDPVFEKCGTPIELNSVIPIEPNSDMSIEPVKVDALEPAAVVRSEPVPFVSEGAAETDKQMETDKSGPSDVTDKIELQCPHCPKICHMQLTYKRHLLVHSGTKDFVCKVCGQAFPLKCNLAVHVKTRHDTEGADPGDVVVKTAKKLAGKAKLKLQVKKLACDQCEETFRFKKELKKHVREVHKVKPRKKEIKAVTYTCPVCEKKFYLQTKLVCHMETEHLISMDLNTSSVETPVMIPPQLIPSPEVATSLLSSPLSVKSTTSKKQKLFSCPTCQKCFRKRKKFNHHIRIHNLQQNLESSQTSVQDSPEFSAVPKEMLTLPENLDVSFTSQGSSEVTFGSQETLDSSVSGSPSVKKSGRTVCLSYCSICGKSFPNRKQLSKHKRKHNLKKRWKKPVVLVVSSSDEKVEEGVSQDPVEVADMERNVTDDVTSGAENACAPVEVGITADESETVLCDVRSVNDRAENIPCPKDKKNVSDCLKTVSADIGNVFNRLFRVEDQDSSASAAATNIADTVSAISRPPKAKKSPGFKKKKKSKSTVVRSVFDDKQRLFEADDSAVDNLSAAPIDPVNPVSAHKAQKSPGDKKKKKATKKKKCIDPSLLTVVCHICGKRFLQKCNAMSHLKQVHDLVETDIPKDILDGMRREYQCEVCPRKFSQKCSLQAHVNKLHSEADPTSKVKVLKSKKKKFKKVMKSSSGGEKEGGKLKRKASGNKELLSLLDGPNLEQAALEEKCRSADGIALKRPRKTLKIPEMNDDRYECHLCGKDYVKFSRLESHISHCGQEKVGKKMKQTFEKFSPKANLIPSVEQASSYALEYDTEGYDEDSTLDTSSANFSPNDTARKQDCDQIEQIEAHVQKLAQDPSPSNLHRGNPSVASAGSVRRTPTGSPTGPKRVLTVLPSDSPKRTTSASPAHRKIRKSGSPRKGRSPGRKPKKARLSATRVGSFSTESVEVASPFETTKVGVTDCKPVMDGAPPELLSSTSEDVLPSLTCDTSEAKIVPKYTPTYSDISDEEDDIPLNELAKVVTSKESLNSSQEKSQKSAPKNAAALRISPRRRSWDVGQIFSDSSVVPSRQISRALTFSNQEQTNIVPEPGLDFEPKYKSYSKTLKTSERQRHCSDDGRVKRKSRWDQPPAPSVSAKPALSVYDFIDDDTEMRIPPVKKPEQKSSVSGDKTILSSSHSKPERSDFKKKTSPSGKPLKIHRKKPKHARWSSPKSKKKSPKIVVAPSYDTANSASAVPNFALANFSPKRKTDYSSANTYNQCHHGATFQTSKSGPSLYDSFVNVSEKPNPTSTVVPCAAKNTQRGFSSSSTSWSSASNIHSASSSLQPNVPLNVSRDASVLIDNAVFPPSSDSLLFGQSTSEHVNAPQRRQVDYNAFPLYSDSSMFQSKLPGHFNDAHNRKDTEVSATHSESVMFGPNAQTSLSYSPVLGKNDGALDLTKTGGATSTSRAATPPVSVAKTDSSISVGRFKCYHCGETFKFHSLYNRHLKKEHKVGRPAADWSL